MTQRSCIVVIRLSALGDVLLTASFVATAAQKYDVIFVTSPAYADLVSLLPGVSQVKVLDKANGYTGQKLLAQELSKLQPTYVFDLHHKPKTMVFARMIKSVKNLSLSKRSFAQGVKALMGHDIILDQEHQSQRYLSIWNDPVAAVQKVQIPQLPDNWVQAGKTFLEGLNIESAKPVIGFAFAATHSTKGWPEIHVNQVIRSLETKAHWVMVGGPSDEVKLKQLKKVGLAENTLDTCHLSLAALAGTVANLDLLIGVDTGPMHLARMLQTPTLTLFGPTSPRRWGPGLFENERHRIVSRQMDCQPCSNHGDKTCPLKHHDCMETLSPQMVTQIADEMLGLTP